MTSSEEIKSHPFFSMIDWEALEKKYVIAPYKPILDNPYDLKHFGTYA